MKTNNNNQTFLSQLLKMAIIPILCFIAISITTISCTNNKCNYSPVCTVQDSVNVSTGLDSVSLVDPNWIASSNPYPLGTPVLVIPAHPGYEPTPIAGTNAGWINMTGSACCANILGNYTYETTFPIAPNILSFSCDFAIAYDDSLVSLELEDPSGNMIPLTEPTHTVALDRLGTNIGTVFNNPAIGTWKIKATIKTADHGTGFLLSGYIKRTKPC